MESGGLANESAFSSYLAVGGAEPKVEGENERV